MFENNKVVTEDAKIILIPLTIAHGMTVDASLATYVTSVGLT